MAALLLTKMEWGTVATFILILLFASSAVETLECPPGAIVRALDGGRLGNLAWEYASVWALAKYLPCNRTPYSTRLINNALSRLFYKVRLPAIDELPENCTCFSFGDVREHNYHQSYFFDLGFAELLTNCSENVVLSRYPMLIQHVWEHADELRQELRYKRKFVKAAYKTMRAAKRKFLSNNIGTKKVTYVGVHVRRTDYPAFLKIYNLPSVGVDYYLFCFNYFRRRTDLGRTIFLVVSDDPEWVAANLIDNNEYGDVFLSSRGGIDRPGYDITMLSLCNHSITDYGSYGYWSAMYSGGEILVTNISYSYAADVLKQYTNWHFVYAKSDGSWHLLDH